MQMAALIGNSLGNPIMTSSLMYLFKDRTPPYALTDSHAIHWPHSPRWDPWNQSKVNKNLMSHTKIKAMSKVSKICHRFQCIKWYVCWRHQRCCLQLLRNTAYSYSFCYSCGRCWRCPILWIIDQRLKIHTNMFLLITAIIFNRFSIRKTFWKAVCWRMSKMSKIILTFDIFHMLQHT